MKQRHITLIATIIAILATVSATAQTDSTTIVRLLSEAKQQKNTSDTTCLPLFFARKFLGLPYVAHTLEINDTEQLVVNTRQLDCTTLVETVTSLTLCARRGQTTYADYCRTLREMRYQDGRIQGYPSRLHYFTQWIVQNTQTGIVTEIQRPNPPFSLTQRIKVDYMSSHPQAYKALKAHPEYIADIRRAEQSITGLTFKYIPKSAISNTSILRHTIHDGDIIAITCSKPGLDIAHLGFAVWHSDGLHLLNASQIHKKVVEEPMTLREYLYKHPSHTGIRILRIRK